MRWLALAWLVLVASCRPKAAPSTAGVDGSADVDPRDVVATTAVPAAQFARPVTARRVDGGIAAVARDQATGDLVLVRFADPSQETPVVMPLQVRLDEPELVTSSLDLGLLGRPSADGGSGGRVLLRVGLAGGAGVTRLDLSPVGTAACATMDGVYSVARESTGWRGTFVALTQAGGESKGPLVSGRSEATIVCGQHRAFVVTNSGGELHAIGWSPNGYDAHPALLPPLARSTPEGETLMAAMDDKLVIAKFRKSTLHTLVWSGEPSGSAWRSEAGALHDGLVLEAMEPAQGQLGLLFVRTIPKVKGCKGNETTDSVAEVALVDATTGKFVHAPESVETWKCGAEAGPFFSGWANGKFVIAWPRGPDVACARAGVRRGGIGYAVVEPGTGRASTGRISRPAETIVEAGCDGSKCFAVALTRGPNPCDPTLLPDSGRLEVIPYP
jgi:hypothetical protein